MQPSDYRRRKNNMTTTDYEGNVVLSTQNDFKVVGTRPVRHDGADKVTGRSL